MYDDEACVGCRMRRQTGEYAMGVVRGVCNVMCVAGQAAMAMVMMMT